MRLTKPRISDNYFGPAAKPTDLWAQLLVLIGNLIDRTGGVSGKTSGELPSYTVAQLLAGTPSAADYPRCMVYVSDGTGNQRLAISDGTSWRFPSGPIVS